MMDGEINEAECKLQITSRMYACRGGSMKLSNVMEIAGYETPEREGGTVYQRVHCTRQIVKKNKRKEIGLPLTVYIV